MRNLERFRPSSFLCKTPNALFPPNPSIGVSEMKVLELVDFVGLREIKHSAAPIVGRCFHCDTTD